MDNSEEEYTSDVADFDPELTCRDTFWMVLDEIWSEKRLNRVFDNPRSSPPTVYSVSRAHSAPKCEKSFVLSPEAYPSDFRLVLDEIRSRRL